MTALKNTGIRILILLVSQTLWLTASHSESPGNAKLNEEFSKQETIYRSEREQVPQGYTIDRSLLDYAKALPSEFDRALATLGPAGRWLDIGAGKAQAILDYYTSNYDLTHPEGREERGKKAQAVAISIEDRRTPLWHQTAASLEANQIQYLSNRRLREYSSEELGQFQVITDVVGGFSYTENLSRFVEKVLGLLELNGSFYTLLQEVNSEDGTKRPHYPGSPFLTEIEDADGSEVRVCRWLKSITCVKVSCESRTGWIPPIEVFRIQKVCNDITVSALEPVHYEAGTPPERRFRVSHSHVPVP